MKLAASNSNNNYLWLFAFISIIAIRLYLMAVVPFIDTSEPRYAAISQIMVEINDWITPWFDPNTPFWGKPPLTFWMSAISFALFGISEFTARIPDLLAILLAAFFLYKALLQLASVTVARLSSLIFLTCTLTFITAGAVLADGYLCLAVTISLLSIIIVTTQKEPSLWWRYALFLGLSLGMLAKGPLTVVLVGITALIWLTAHKQLKNFLKKMPWISGSILFLVLSLPWYIAAEIKTPGFLHYFIIGEHFSRFLDPGWHGDRYGAAHKVAHGGIWLAGLEATFPWIFIGFGLLIMALIKNSSRKVLCNFYKNPLITFFVIWCFITPLFFTMAGNIIWTYVLPSIPGFAVVLAIAISHWQTQIRATKIIVFCSAFLLPVIAFILGTISYINPLLVETEKPLIACYKKTAKNHENLYYVDDRPFSARFYSNEKVQIIKKNDVQTLVTANPEGIYLAIDRHDAKSALYQQYPNQVIFPGSKEFVLIYISQQMNSAMMASAALCK